MKRTQKVFIGVPAELEKLLNEGWYLESVLSVRFDEGNNLGVWLVVHLSKLI